MFGLYILFSLAALASLLLSPILAIVALRHARRAETETTRLQASLTALERAFSKSQPEADSGPQPETTPKRAPPAPQPPGAQSKPAGPEAISVRPAISPTPPPSPVSWRRASDFQKETAAKKDQAKKTERQNSFEETIASRWFVWLGGVTIALGGIFLVKYSIDHALLSPAVRLSLAFLLGATLVALGEWIRRRPLQKKLAALSPDYVPPALAGAGVLICFGSVYAGYALYTILPPLTAFILLAVIAAGALALSLLQGPFLAALGLLGAFVVPALVQTGSASAWALFGYLLFVAGAALAVVRYREWWWLAGITLLGSFLWQSIWLITSWNPGNTLPLSVHLIVLLAMSFAIRFPAFFDPNRKIAHPLNLQKLPPQEFFVLGTAVCLSVLAIALVRSAGYTPVALLVFALITLALTAAALWIKNLECLLAVAALSSIALILVWNQSGFSQLPLPGRGVAIGGPAGYSAFIWVNILLAVGFGGAGHLGITRARQPDLWSAVSAGVPFISLIVCYWRIGPIVTDLAWGTMAMGLAVLATAAATRMERIRENPGIDAALGIYALAVIAGISLAATMTLERSWLTIALAIELPALAWVHGKLKIAYLRQISKIVAGIVGLRLVFLNSLPGFSLPIALDAVWILYSYGIPAIAFGLTALWFRRSEDDQFVTFLETGAIAIAVAMISLEIRVLSGNEFVTSPSYSLFEQSLHTLSWLASGCSLYYGYRKTKRQTALFGAQVLLGLATAQVVIGHIMLANPLLTGELVGRLPVFNVLFLAYLVPALFAAFLYVESKRQNHRDVSLWAGVATLLLTIIYLSMEVRHLYHGPDLKVGPMTDAEGYTYSFVWLIYAGSLLALGILKKIATVRRASLVLLMLVIAKVFLWDVSWLTGLYRIASFLGLGFCLVAVGFLYQRFVIRLDADTTPQEATPEEPTA